MRALLASFVLVLCAGCSTQVTPQAPTKIDWIAAQCKLDVLAGHLPELTANIPAIIDAIHSKDVIAGLLQLGIAADNAKVIADALAACDLKE